MDEKRAMLPAEPGPEPGGAESAPRGQYELTSTQDHTVARTARVTTIWGYIALVIGALSVLGMFIAPQVAARMAAELGVDLTPVIIAALVPIAIVHLVVGWLYIKSGGAMRAVVDTSGNDIALLMSGLGKLTYAFRVEVTVTVLGMIGGFVAGLALAMSGG